MITKENDLAQSLIAANCPNLCVTAGIMNAVGGQSAIAAGKVKNFFARRRWRFFVGNRTGSRSRTKPAVISRAGRRTQKRGECEHIFKHRMESVSSMRT
jgi:hypothetical protein